MGFVVLLCVDIRMLIMTKAEYHCYQYLGQCVRMVYERLSKEKIICWNKHTCARTHFKYLNGVNGSLMHNEDRFLDGTASNWDEVTHEVP